jgi:hypothetical protein
MHRFTLLVSCSLALVSCTADPSTTDERHGSVEQGLTACESVGLDDWKGEELFSLETRNPTLVLTAGDSERTFYAWGVENGERVLWVKRVPVDAYGDFMMHVHREWAEMERPGASANYGVAGSIVKGGPIDPPGPIGDGGFPPRLVAKVLSLADAQLGATEHFFNGLGDIGYEK